MEISFKPIELCDLSEIRSFLKDSDRRLCEYSFANMYCWGAQYGMSIARLEGALVFGYPKSGSFFMPTAAPENAVCALKLLMRDYPRLTLRSLTEQDRESLENLFPDKFDFSENRAEFDYIYPSRQLQTLSGKKLASKRNHINAFVSDGEWRTERITGDIRDALLEFNKRWCKNRCGGMSLSLKNEMCAAEKMIVDFERLGLSGLALYKNGRLVAYSIGEPISDSVFCVHLEKADEVERGAYQMINREFARQICAGYEYINREDDAGDEGLRRAKMSYHPTELGKKYRATVRVKK